MNTSEAAAAVGVSTGTLRRWVREGVVPEYVGAWTPAALGKARLVARVRERGYSLSQIREATEDGRLAFGRVLELFDLGQGIYTRRQVARETGLDGATIDRVTAILGLSPGESLDDADVQLLRYVAAALDGGLPLEALLQLTRVYVQAMSQIADAEVRLVHLYVHEPLLRSGGSADEMAGELFNIAGDLLPLSSPLIEQLHRRMLLNFIDQDIVGHMETEVVSDAADAGRMLVAIAFADLAGYTQLTEREGDLHALAVVERFLDVVNTTLPDDARVIKTLGDEVMIVGSDAAALTAWAVALEARLQEQPRPRIAVHYGHAVYRDGDYYGREVNLAARVAGESGAGQVLVTRPVVAAAGPELQFAPIADVRLRGFSESTEIFLASASGSVSGGDAG